MKVDEMMLLLRVAETGSMTLAARQLHLTPAGVSAAVQRIEAMLGVRVFERTTRSVHPTDDGLVVLQGCEEVVAVWEKTLEQMHGTERGLEGTVHISAPADTSYQLIAGVVVAMADAHPKLQVIVHSSDAVHHLHRDAIDIAIRYGSLEDSTLMARKLAEFPGVLVAAPSYLDARRRPETPDDLQEHQLITLQLASVPITTWTLHGPSGPRQVALQSPLCGDGYLARQWALDGVGIAMKSLFDVIDDLEANRLVRVLPQFSVGAVPIHAMFTSRQYMPARVRALDVALAAVFDARSRRCDAWLRHASGSDER